MKQDEVVPGASTDGADSVIEVEFSGRVGRFPLDVAFKSSSDRVVLFGPSGSGKTLTLRAIAGIWRPQRARIAIRGKVYDDTAARLHVPSSRRAVGYVPQGYALFPHMSVRQNVLYGVRELGTEERDRRCRDIIGMVGLEGMEDARPSDLSGGQQQRVALARALATNPLCLLLDEPLAAIDTPLRAGLRAELARLQADAGAAMITVTHDLSDAFALGDRIVIIDGGRVLQQGSRDDVYYRPATRKVADLVGIRNVLSATITDISDQWVVLAWKGLSLTALSRDQHPVQGQAVEVCIRSTQLMIRRPEDSEFGGRLNVIAGTIVDEVVMAETRRLFVKVEGSGARYDLEVDLPEYTYFRLRLDSNKEVEMSVKPEWIHLLSDVGSAARSSSGTMSHTQ